MESELTDRLAQGSERSSFLQDERQKPLYVLAIMFADQWLGRCFPATKKAQLLTSSIPPSPLFIEKIGSVSIHGVWKYLSLPANVNRGDSASFPDRKLQFSLEKEEYLGELESQ